MNALKGVVGRNNSFGVPSCNGSPRLRLRGSFSVKCSLSHCTRYQHQYPTTKFHLPPQQRYFSKSGIASMADTTKWTAPVVRKTFLEYFEGKGHTIGMYTLCVGATLCGGVFEGKNKLRYTTIVLDLVLRV
jgi:hypothetical protein